MDRLYAKIYEYDDGDLGTKLTDILQRDWHSEVVHQYWRYPNMEIPYQPKNGKDVCDNLCYLYVIRYWKSTLDRLLTQCTFITASCTVRFQANMIWIIQLFY